MACAGRQGRRRVDQTSLPFARNGCPRPARPRTKTRRAPLTGDVHRDMNRMEITARRAEERRRLDWALDLEGMRCLIANRISLRQAMRRRGAGAANRGQASCRSGTWQVRACRWAIPTAAIVERGADPLRVSCASRSVHRIHGVQQSEEPLRKGRMDIHSALQESVWQVCEHQRIENVNQFAAFASGWWPGYGHCGIHNHLHHSAVSSVQWHAPHTTWASCRFWVCVRRRLFFRHTNAPPSCGVENTQ